MPRGFINTPGKFVTTLASNTEAKIKLIATLFEHCPGMLAPAGFLAYDFRATVGWSSALWDQSDGL
ncbi:hypothetical protein PtB15_8B39 [Puccinia triticina]|nr:hypothetical protein PtB15_8B39 [Puccinia triticina]